MPFPPQIPPSNGGVPGEPSVQHESVTYARRRRNGGTGIEHLRATSTVQDGALTENRRSRARGLGSRNEPFAHDGIGGGRNAEGADVVIPPLIAHRGKLDPRVDRVRGTAGTQEVGR